LYFHLGIASRRLLEGAEVKLHVFQTNRKKRKEEVEGEEEIFVILVVDLESTTNSRGGASSLTDRHILLSRAEYLHRIQRFMNALTKARM
jgi:hypothetical protein